MDKSRFKRLAKPPVTALKTIQAGRLRGMTDINPQWRYEAMNDEFGPCGEGWAYRIVDLWTVPGALDEVFAFAKIEVLTGENTLPIPGIGGSKLISLEKGGLHNNDEAFKMAVTDALSVALKMLGVGSDIYMGLWDGTKYREQQKPESSKAIGEAEYAKLSEEKRRYLDGIADEIKVKFDVSNEEAYKVWTDFRATEPLVEEVSACSWLLPSNIRSTFKKLAGK